MEFEVVASGLGFPEGPVVLDDGSVLVVEIERKTLTRVRRGGELQVIADLGGGPNGVAIGPDGAAYVCNNGGTRFRRRSEGTLVPVGVPDDYAGGSIQRVDLSSGKAEVLYAACDGVRLKGPNDIVFDEVGGFWFTDMGKLWPDRFDHGALFYARPDGSAITRVRASLLTPNGVGLSPDGRTVWVSESYTSRVWGFDLAAPGRLTPEVERRGFGRVLGPLPGYQILDSLAVEANGLVCVATPSANVITLFSPDGAVEQLAVPSPVPTNLCFGGDDRRTAWIAGSGRGELLRTRWPRPGLKLNF